MTRGPRRPPRVGAAARSGELGGPRRARSRRRALRRPGSRAADLVYKGEPCSALRRLRPTHQVGPQPINPSSRDPQLGEGGEPGGGVPSVPGSRGSQGPRRPAPADKAGSSPTKRKIFPGSLYLLIFQFLAAALPRPAAPRRGGGRADHAAAPIVEGPPLAPGRRRRGSS